ncbi:hypothetical protein Mapa_014367 [Marchantia paleacea]|nr:hypothetical protein Mapa_014367 [Marchantia paleacea]
MVRYTICYSMMKLKREHIFTRNKGNRIQVSNNTRVQVRNSRIQPRIGAGLSESAELYQLRTQTAHGKSIYKGCGDQYTKWLVGIR